MSSAEAFLEAWHARHPGASRTAFLGARGPDGRSSYERLAVRVDGSAEILDLACGDGTLLSAIRVRAPRAKLLGIDMSGAELALARARLPGAALQLARAQELPFDDASVDAVTCHMALMLMDEPDRVVAEVRRVLRRGGIFAATVGRNAAAEGDAARIMTALQALRAAHDPPPLRVGDERTRDAAGLAALLAPHFDGFVAETISATQDVPVAALWPFLKIAYYGFEALPDAEAAAAVDALRVADPVTWTFELIEIACVAR